MDTESFVKAIAPVEDLTKIGRRQFSILFRVADTSKRGLVSWEDFVVFETLLKRADADYYVAFQYFDVYALFPPLSDRRSNGKWPHSDSSGTITFDEFKNVFKANIKPDAIPFHFDWYKLSRRYFSTFLTVLRPLTVTGLNSTWEPRTAPMFSDVCTLV